MDLLYKTREKNNLDVQKKERVYFTCHPDDFNSYFELISSDIFETQNCAIYYKEDPNAKWNNDEDIETDLTRMQLFVMPITSQFLDQENQARNIELPFAIEHKIPVLPVIEENGLENKFNEICGDLQCIDKAELSDDLTATPYDKKLEDFLSSILLGDQLADIVRDAFDAYIFMSYRKMDRGYAQELMKIIHNIDFCRDIAIWYDEFLVPGEHFNNAIKEAIEKSSLCTFVITPNIMKQSEGSDNYVVAQEFPVVIKMGKPILPVEMEMTDHEQLRKMFNGMPEPINAYDNDFITNAFKEQFYNLGVKKCNDDPYHLYLIGLAYLGGIDVEINYDRAVQLLTEAAHKNVPEAMGKLSQMYKIGEGVKQDLEMSAKLMEKLSNYWESKISDKLGIGYEEQLRYSLWQAGDLWFEIRRFASARKMYNKIINAIQYIDKYDNIRGYKDLYDCYCKIGDTYKSEGELDLAEEQYKKGLKVMDYLSKMTKSPGSKSDLAFSYGKMAKICELRGDICNAREYCQTYIDLSEELYKDNKTTYTQRNKVMSNNLMGELNYCDGNFEKAEEYYISNLNLCKDLDKENKTVESRQELINCYCSLGEAYKSEGRLNEAKGWYETAMELSEKLNNKAGTIKSKRSVYLCYDAFGQINTLDGKLNEAEVWVHKALTLCEELYQQTNSMDVGIDLANEYQEMGEIKSEEKDISNAKKWGIKSVSLAEKLNSEYDTVEVRRILSGCYIFMGDISLKEEKNNEAEKWYFKGLKPSKELVRETNATINGPTSYNIIQLGLGNVYMAKGEFSEAKKWYKKYYNTCDKVNNQKNTIVSMKDLAESCEKLGDVCMKEEHFRDAKMWYLRCKDLCEKIRQRTSFQENDIDLAACYEKLGDTCEKEGNHGEADEWYKKAMKRN